MEAIKCGVTEVAARDLRDRYQKLQVVDSVMEVSRMEEEFKKVQATIHLRMAADVGMLPVNKAKNRYYAINTLPCRLPYHAYKIYLYQSNQRVWGAV